MLSADDRPGITFVRALPSTLGELGAACGIRDTILECSDPRRFVALAAHDPDVVDDERDLSAVASDDRYPAREGFHEHPPKLLAPARRGLTRGAHNVHCAEVCGDGV